MMMKMVVGTASPQSCLLCLFSFAVAVAVAFPCSREYSSLAQEETH
ncbi:hypothetical protein Ahy_A03g016997 isoform C [Arachis hypogaea]|uniref:Uncharacterized protein n=1 Tax=Arachis hypogaea TaxID=3818 RepID=A0A445E4Z1_ARAHY|nr:hypothetical protein Ahy_A03g016997 isoform C [Arachis hypogaea]